MYIGTSNNESAKAPIMLPIVIEIIKVKNKKTNPRPVQNS